MAIIKSVNPANKKILGKVEVFTKAEIKEAVEGARNAKEAWGELGVAGRVRLMKKVYDAFYKRRDELAKMDSSEMGFPITQCNDFNLGDAFSYFKWYLDNAEKYLSPETTLDTKKEVHKVYYDPKGVVAVIQPWNYPFCQWVWSAVPNLLVGNTVVYKPSEEVPLSAKLIEEIVGKSGLPKGVLSFVYGDGKVGEYLVNQDIDLIVFTGSTSTGQKLYKIAAEKFTPVLLELGGSAPGIVFEDVDADKVAETVYWQRFANCGQACDGLKRLIVHKDVAADLTEKLKVKLEKSKIGDPLDKDTFFGPLVSEKQLKLIEEQVKDAVSKGAKIVTGGKRPKGLKGFYFEPTLLTDIKPDMHVWQEEVFGPVLPVVTFKTENEAVKLANDTKYGLGSYVYTKDLKRAQRVAEKIETGMVSVNGANYVLPMNPFGGNKMSGLGREHGKWGLRELCNNKVIASLK
jgi:succinate-semialdehyde dehydrogenase / glutarate-semialdehyde dehydrogenase